jgi:pyruvate dehydrogenase E2 component (dihydrolipoamide acetyltransferase)
VDSMNETSPSALKSRSLYDFEHHVGFELDRQRTSLCIAQCGGSNHNGSVRILLLHGNPANLDDWRILASLFHGDYEIVAADLPGFGKSDPLKPSSEPPLDASARIVVGLADSLGWTEPFFIVGHSHGAAVAQVIAARYPDRIAGIALIASQGSPAHAAYQLLAFPGVGSGLAVISRLLHWGCFASIFRPLLKVFIRPIFHPAPPPREEIDQRLRYLLENPHVLASMAYVASGSPSAQLLRYAEKIRAPALFFHGARDRLIPLASAKALFTVMLKSSGRASFEVIEDGGHMIHITHALEVSRRILAWTRMVNKNELISPN